MPDPGRVLVVRLAIGAAVAVAAVVAGRPVGLVFAPAPTVLIALVIATLSWLASAFQVLAPRPEWEQPHPPAHAARYTADLATRRVANMFVRARPGMGFEAGATAQLLDGLVRQRADDDRPLSPELDAYLAAARDGRPQPLHRRALHAHLKEIDQL